MVVVLLILGCLVFAVIRYRHAERQKALEMEQWADRRRSHGTVNPMYAIPADAGGSVTVFQDPFRVADSSNLPLYDLVQPGDGYDTYGEVLSIDDECTGYLNVGSPDHDPTALNPQTSTICDLAQPQSSSRFSRGSGTSFKIPAEHGSSVVAYRDADSIVAGAADLAPEYVDPYAPPGASYNTVVPAETPADVSAVLLASLGPGAVGAPPATGPIASISFRKPNPATSTILACAHMSAHKTCAFKAAGPSQYCSNHTCTLVGCLNNKPSGQAVCDQHSIGSIDLYGHQTAPPAIDVAL